MNSEPRGWERRGEGRRPWESHGGNAELALDMGNWRAWTLAQLLTSPSHGYPGETTIRFKSRETSLQP